MTKTVSIDVSGLSWRYRTGVQNLFWAYVNAWLSARDNWKDFKVIFFDRSGLFNHELHSLLNDEYISEAPSWWPKIGKHPLKFLISKNIYKKIQLESDINMVWNWDIYHSHAKRHSITIPDILPFEYPHLFSKKFIDLTKKSLYFAKNRADYVFTISHDVKNKVINLTGLPEERVRVVYPGIDSRYFIQPTDDQITRTLTKYRLKGRRYFLSSGFLDPRKNLLRQIKAFAAATGGRDSDVKYALTGVETNLSNDILSLINQPDIRGRVVFLGYVPFDDLVCLMRESAALMYCSIAEGFGLPIIEAMATGARVITSNTTSMREISEGRAPLVDPVSVDSIAAAITSVLNSNSISDTELLSKNQSFASQFTIENWLDGHLSAFNR